jgi:hypothetical protein
LVGLLRMAGQMLQRQHQHLLPKFQELTNEGYFQNSRLMFCGRSIIGSLFRAARNCR